MAKRTSTMTQAEMDELAEDTAAFLETIETDEDFLAFLLS